jgi:quinol monooxygenase YgiN
MIHVIATIELAPGVRETYLEEFRKLVPLVRAEPGCLEYGPTVDLPSGLAAQLPPRDQVVTVVEKWDTLAALYAHASAPHILAWRERVKDMVKKVRLAVLQPV